MDKEEKRKEFDKKYTDNTDNFRAQFKEDEYDDKGMNLLHYCVLKNHVSTVLVLMKCGYGNTLYVDINRVIAQTLA